MDINGSDEKLVGVSGWLLFHCILLCILQPLMMLVGLGSDGQSVPGVLAVAGAVLGIWGLIVGAMLWSRSEGALVNVRTYWRGNVVISILVALVLLATYGPRAGLFLVDAVRSVLASALWLAYFKRSKRVRATYPAAFVEEGAAQATASEVIATQSTAASVPLAHRTPR